MKERPIRFSAPMVRAILDGSKTQTRRVVKPRADRDMGPRCVLQPHELAGEVNGGRYRNSIYGQPGDRLWVRETFAIVPRTAYARSDGVQQTLRPDDDHDAAIYRAGWNRSNGGFRWRPSIHMPRWASRILLEITDVRVEKLQDISEADARAEGMCVPNCECGYGVDGAILSGTASGAFALLWEQIYGPDSWIANPWVWVIEFRRIEP